MRTAVDIAAEVADIVLDFTEPFQDWIDPFQERLYNAVKDTAFILELQRDAKSHQVESMVTAVFLDWAYDLTSVILGHDLFSGEKLSHEEELLSIAAIAIPVLTVAVIKLGPKVMRAGGFLARHADEALEEVEFAARHADELGDVTRAVTHHSDEVLDAATTSARYGDDIVDGGRDSWRHLDEYRVSSEVAEERFALQNRLDDWVAPSHSTTRYGDEVVDGRHADNSDNFGGSCAIPARNSFTAGTIVETDEGDKPIETIEEGDNVLGEDPETGEQGYYEVVSVRSHLKDEIVAVTIASDDGETVMETTPDHPVYIEEKGWIWAENLEPGDTLRTSDDTWAEVVSIEYIQLDEPELVYNFTVKGPHTYFVLKTAVLVHNCKEVPNAGEVSKSENRLVKYDPQFAAQQQSSDKIVLYHGLSESGLERFRKNGLQLRSIQGYRGAGLYLTPDLEEAIQWAKRHDKDNVFVLRFEVDRNEFDKLKGLYTDVLKPVDPMRHVVEMRAIQVNPRYRKGFPTDPNTYYNDVVKSFSPKIKREQVTPIDYLHGEVSVRGKRFGTFGYEYVFKSDRAVQDVLNNPYTTRISVMEPKGRSQTWKPITFPYKP